MARFNKLYVDKLFAKKIAQYGDGSRYTIRDLTIIPGENATTTLSQQLSVSYNAYLNDAFFAASTVNAAHYRITVAGIDYAGLMTGTTAGNMATSDRISVMTVMKGGVGNYVIGKAGTATGTAGASTIVINDPTILATDLAFGQTRATGTGSRTVDKLVCTAGVLTITMSGAMTASHTVDYCIVRAVGLDAENYKIAVVGSGALAASGAGASDTVVATGVKASDIIIAQALTSADPTAYMLSCVPTLNTLTMTFSAAPGAGTYGYMALRPV